MTGRSCSVLRRASDRLSQLTTSQPVVLGEFGGFYSGKDAIWQDWAIGELARRGIGAFYFCLNPDSDDST